MLPLHPSNLAVEEQLLQAKRKYNELLNADAEFEVLKLIRLKIKWLQTELDREQVVKNSNNAGIAGFSVV